MTCFDVNYSNSVFSKKYKRQLSATLTGLIVAFSYGISLGWITPMIYKLHSASSPLAFRISIEEASWIGSLSNVGGLAGTIFFGFLIDRVGRKICLYILPLPHAFFWVMVYFTSNVYHLYLARLIGGITGGGIFLIFPIFISEIADPQIRGTLGSLVALFTNVGVLIGNIVASHVSYHIVPPAVLTLPIMSIAFLVRCPETPQHLLKKGYFDRAKNSLKYYSYHNHNVNNEDGEDKFNTQFAELKEAINLSNIQQKVSSQDFMNKRSLKGMATGITIIFINVFCGFYSITNYSSLIFAQTKSSIDPYTSTIVIGGVMILGSYVASFFVDKFGRKILMMISSGSMAILLASFGGYVYLTDRIDLTRIHFLPVLLISFIIFTGSTGIAAITFVLLVEVLPPKIRSLGATLCQIVMGIFAFGALKLFPVLMASIVIIIAYSYGIGLGWLSPMLLLFQSEDSPLMFKVTVEQVSWIGSLTSIGGMLGTILFGIILDLVGRKMSLYLLPLPHMAFWIIIYFAHEVYHLYIARFLGGVTGGGIFVVISIFISEIADPRVRGSLGSLFIFTINSGMVSGFVIGSYIPYFVIPGVILTLPILNLLLLTQYPETPQYLLRKGKTSLAEKSFKFYKNHKSGNKEQDQQMSLDFNELKTNIQSAENQKKVTIHDFLTKRALNGLGIGGILMGVYMLSGNFAIINYSSIIFADIGSILNPNGSSIVIGLAQILGSYSATILVDRLGRRMLMMLSTSFLCTGCAIVGAYSYLSHHNDLTNYQWIPLVMISFVIFSANLGVVSVSFVILVEVLPLKIRSLGSTFCLVLMGLFSTISLKAFPVLMTIIGLAGVMWICGGVALFGFIFNILYLKETKGKSLDIEKP
ncbi:facilitated trehalose transporter Tret1-like [Eupeodes corollae]|uniref:facilitated trehalose transporter Tret1-like n=1 Tax=Eupeodes corollae TaxID=290404 RepID=UPI0024927A64|nr:facilitated trehalose transporter Tret1-like [Eupeodes corollae]